MKKRALIQPEVTKRDRWSVDLETKAKVHDKAVVDTKKAVVANAAAAAELKAAKAELELIVGDWKLRAAAWRAAQTRHAAGKLCRHIPDSEPERKQSCLSELFDGSNPALRECLDLPFVQLTAFKACLDRKVAGT